jgi:hypothetical protein
MKKVVDLRKLKVPKIGNLLTKFESLVPKGKNTLNTFLTELRRWV